MKTIETLWKEFSDATHVESMPELVNIANRGTFYAAISLITHQIADEIIKSGPIAIVPISVDIQNECRKFIDQTRADLAAKATNIK